jgi:alpha-mannosidase
MKIKLSLLMLATIWGTGFAAENAVLWQIGKPDHDDAEFALAPKNHAQFQNDGFFVVGRSDPKQDWPYVHPGPSDGWAGGRSHTFGVVFAVKEAAGAGECRLRLDFVDTHSGGPPHLRVVINGRAFDRDLPAGGGDESILGLPSHGKPCQWELAFPASLIKAGDNEIQISNTRGSWAIYDALSLEAPATLALAPVAPRTWISSVEARPVLLREGERVVQPVQISVGHFSEVAEADVRADGQVVAHVQLRQGMQVVDAGLKPVDSPAQVKLELVVGGKVTDSRSLPVAPPRLREIWLLPHSHVDIGYTHRQDNVIGLQIGNLEKAMQLAEASATNPPGMRFKWNPEAVWSLDHFLQRATPEKRAAFIAAVRRGDVGVDALYGNMLTGLCRPEELAQCLAFGARLSTLTGIPVLSASICDVPGYTWGLVSMMGQAGVKYFAIGPNFGDRVGTIHQWDNRPFYWQSPSGKEKLLCWVVDNYHFFGNLEEHALQQMARLEKTGFPYDTTFLFWVGLWPNGGVDNAPPDEQIVEKVKAWNQKYAAPRIVIGLAGEFFKEFEKRHGAQLPVQRGDLTPYWEDGAGSTARETALNRATGDRLQQADFLYALLAPSQRPADRFDAAWKNVLLYSEHTWGAWCSISKPDDAFTLDQWKVKGEFALHASQQSQALLRDALATRGPAVVGTTAIDVFNTTQWPRTGLAVVPKDLTAGDRIADEKGVEQASQKLSSGEWVFLARDVPPFGAKRYQVVSGQASRAGKAMATSNSLATAQLQLQINPLTGAIQSLRKTGANLEWVDAQAPVGLNEYRYLLGTDAKGAKGNSQPVIRVMDSGPLVATLRIESDAPGCVKLTRDVRVVDGLDWVELVDAVDRQSVREKDGVHFGFGFNVPQGKIHMETPWAVVRPNLDQLPGSCRNWFTVQRWVDVSNPEYGVLWAPLDAPLMEIGGLTANLLGSVAYHEWMTNAIDSQTLYSWAQNNHWHTNYKIDQPGVTTFRFILRPHLGGYSAAASARFGLETSRPLIASVAVGASAPKTLVRVSSPDVLVETVKMSTDGKAYIVRLWGMSDKNVRASLKWSRPLKGLWLSDLTEEPLRAVRGSIEVPAGGALTVRAVFE